jgi:spore coat protein A, manganese oxidase
VTGDRMVDPANPGGSLITAPAERWDVVVDFKGLAGKKYILCNDAPAPFPMGAAINDYPNANNPNGNTLMLMRFEVKPDSPRLPADPPFSLVTEPLAGNAFSGIDKPLAGIVPSTSECDLNWLVASTAPLPAPARPGVSVRQVTLNESFDEYGRLIQREGNNVATAPGGDFSRSYCDPATEVVKAGATEVWQIVNLTGDTHPIHVHLANAQLLSRQPFDVAAYQATPVGAAATPVFTGPARGPLETELGWKETFKSNPGEVTTIIMKFNLPKTPFKVPASPRTGGNEYVWHCHILEHEEHDMMRPLVVV